MGGTTKEKFYMRILIISLIIALLISSISVMVLSQRLYAAATDKDNTANIDQDAGIKAAIKLDMDKIAQEREAIIADRRKLKEAKRTGDKIKIEQVKQEIDQDIKKRKAAIKDLYSDIGNKTPTGFDVGPRRKKVK